MSESKKFTPGPWVVTEDIRTEEEVEYIAGFNIEDAFGDEIVGSEGIYGDFGENRNNAYLIAAAPDLLEALEMAEAMLCRLEPIIDRGEDDSISVESEILFARAAISKARGQQ